MIPRVVSLFRLVNGKIQEFEKKVAHVKVEILNRKGELAVKNSKLADVEIEVKFLHLRKAILTTQKENLTETKNEIFKDYVSKNLI